MPHEAHEERWTQLTIETETSPDRALLSERITPLIESLRDRLEAWHFFWEPDLWLRFRWRSERARDEGHALIRERLAPLAGWRFEPYDWAADAAMMGDAMWPLCQRDWMNGAELALAQAQAEAQPRPESEPKGLDFHWARHVHLFSNQTVGTWAEEARLCLRQARYRTWLLSRTRGNEAQRPALEASLASLDALIADIDVLSVCEHDFVDRWRRAGRPDIASQLDLPSDFAAKREEDGVAGEG